MDNQIQEAEAAVRTLEKRYDELSIFIGMAEDCMKDAKDEPEYLKFWDQHNRLCKRRNDIRLKRFAANAFLSVKKAEARVMGFFL